MSKEKKLVSEYKEERMNNPTITGLYAYNIIEKYCINFLGEILTIIDATYSEERQNKAMKDVVRQSLYRMLNNMQGDFSQIDVIDGATWGSDGRLEEKN